MPKTRHIRPGRQGPPGTRGYSLLELMVVIAITVLLTAIMFPGISAAKSSAHKLMCASNLRQLGVGTILYSGDHKDQIPGSQLAEQNRPLDQMAVTCLDTEPGAPPNRFVLDGLGLLIGGGKFGCYCDAAQCLYCPAHTSEHTYEAYEDSLELSNVLTTFEKQAWSNYHYVGHDTAPELTVTRVTLSNELLLVTDGFRTKGDYNHGNGMNRLYGDGSIEWWQDVSEEFLTILPSNPIISPELQRETFTQAWTHFEQAEHR